MYSQFPKITTITHPVSLSSVALCTKFLIENQTICLLSLTASWSTQVLYSKRSPSLLWPQASEVVKVGLFDCCTGSDTSCFGTSEPKTRSKPASQLFIENVTGTTQIRQYTKPGLNYPNLLKKPGVGFEFFLGLFLSQEPKECNSGGVRGRKMYLESNHFLKGFLQAKHHRITCTLDNHK